MSVTARQQRRFSTMEAMQRSGATFRQINYWEQMGAIHPSVPAAGPGSRRAFSEADLLALRTVTILAALGAQTPTLGAVWAFLAALPWRDGWLLASPTGAPRHIEASEQVAPGPFGWLVDLGAVRADVLIH